MKLFIRVFLILICSWTLSACTDQDRFSDLTVKVTSAKLTIKAATDPPADDLELDIAFDDHWWLERRLKGPSGTYKFTVDLPTKLVAAAPLGFYLPNHSGHIWVYWDNELIGKSHTPTDRGPVLASGPLLLTLPATLASAGRHDVVLKFQGGKSQPSYVIGPQIGPLNVLQQDYGTERIKIVLLPLGLGVVSVVLALLFFAIFRNDPSAQGVPWLTGGLLLSAMAVFGLYYAPPAALADLFERLRPMSYHLAFLCYCYAFNALRSRSHRGTWFIKTLTVVELVYGIAILSVPAEYSYVVAAAWVPVTTLLAILLMYRVARLSWSSDQNLLPIIPIVFVLFTMFHDAYGLSVSGGDFWAGQSLQLFNPSLLALSLMWLLVSRANLHLRELLSLSRDLEVRVDQKHAELQSNYEKLADADRREAVIDERERMVREMHDGLGSQLVSTLAMVESGQFSDAEVEDALRDSIDDLRMMVNSLDQDESSIVDLLALVRERIEPRIARQGMRFRWRVDDLPNSQPLSPESSGHVLRIVQEALANILKHAKATTITLSTGTVGEEIFLAIEDNGHGMESTADNNNACTNGGRGLKHMQQRAEKLGGRLTFEPASAEHSGTRVTLWLPISQVEEQ